MPGGFLSHSALHLYHNLVAGVFHCVLPLHAISRAANAEGSRRPPTNQPSPCLGLTSQMSRRLQLKTKFVLGGQNRLASLLKLSRINGGEGPRLHFTKLNLQIFHSDPYFSSMAVLNFSTLSSLRS